MRAGGTANQVVSVVDEATQSRIASFIASFRVCVPDSTAITSAPSRRIRRNVEVPAARCRSCPCRRCSRASNSAAAVAGGDPVLTGAGLGNHPVLPIRRVSSAWPSTLLILCEPVWFRSSRFNTMTGVTPSGVAACSLNRLASVIGLGRPV